MTSIRATPSASSEPSPIASEVESIASASPGIPFPTAVPSPPGNVPILYYHRIEAVPPGFALWSHQRQLSFLRYDTLPVAFAAQLDWLVAHGYQTILPRDLAAYWDGGMPLPAKPVILTFDDGFASWMTTVLPALRARGMIAEFYLTLDAIVGKQLRWSDVRELSGAGNGIGGHDVHHVQLAGGHGAALPIAVMRVEVEKIRTIIMANIGVAPDSMAYVGGGFDADLVRIVQAAGYTTARSIIRGVIQKPSQRYLLRVVRIGGRDDLLDPIAATLVPGMPTFAARMRGVSDLLH